MSQKQIKCKECGIDVTEETTYLCSDCEESVCAGCIRTVKTNYANSVEYEVCKGCAYETECTICKVSGSADNYKFCSRCDEVCCKSCIKGSVCANCVKEEQIIK